MGLFSLADRLGKTVGEIERGMTCLELAEWFAYFRIKSRKD